MDQHYDSQIRSRNCGDKKLNDEIEDKIVTKNTSEGKSSVQLYGAPHIEFLECERLLVPGVRLHQRFY